MATHWKIYRGGPNQTDRSRFAVSIDRKGTLTLNAYTLKQIGSPEAVILMFDDQQSVIGITPSAAHNPEAFPVRIKPGDTTARIHASPFCRHFNIKPTRTERFDTPALDDEGVLTLDLKRTHDIGRTAW